MKIKIYDKELLMAVGRFAMLIGSILSIIALFDSNIISSNKVIVVIISLVLLIAYYLYKIIYIIKLNNISLKICGSTFEIKEGNIFEQDGLKVINFNEYFDTIVDNRIIAENSLNGKYILNVLKNDVTNLDNEIEKQLKEKCVEENNLRKKGKRKKYNLGEIVEYNSYLLTSLTKFTDDNRAVLSLKEYLSFLMNFWDNLDKIYANRNVNITLFGSSSLTRFTDAYEINEQDLIEIIIWSFKVSKIKFKYPTKITLVLSKELLSKINLYKVREMYRNGL